jgi:hypothetical protein
MTSTSITTTTTFIVIIIIIIIIILIPTWRRELARPDPEGLPPIRLPPDGQTRKQRHRNGRG